MEIKEFGNIIVKEMSDALGDEYFCECRDVLKNNGKVYLGLVISKKGEKISPTIYLNSFFEEYKRGKSIKRITDSVVKVYKESVPETEVDLDFFTDFAEVSKKLCFKVINYEKNKKKLKDIPYRRVMDLAMVPLFYFEQKGMRSGYITIMKSHLKLWEISEDELWENVGESAPIVCPVKMREISEYLERLTGQEIEGDICSCIYVITNKDEHNGAGAAFYPGVLKELSDYHESDLYIIPSSVHECIVMPDFAGMMGPEAMKDMIVEVNRDVVADEEVLSDNLYQYSREDDRLYICG